VVSCTIVIPTHNREDLLKRAVCSALSACPVDGEVLVVDDKSSVPAEALLTTLHDPRLRIHVNPEASGAANARNWGVSQARGDTVFFLDDDDELRVDYCARVLASVNRARWGFASTVERSGSDVLTDRLRLRPRLRRGLVPDSAPLKDRVAAVSDGFWIRRETFHNLGGFDSQQVIDEDTDLCLRLISSVGSPWYEDEPGTIVYRGYVPANQQGAQLTVATAVQTGLICYRRTYERNAVFFAPLSQGRWFLCTRFLRRAVKQGQLDIAREFVRSLSPLPLRMTAAAFLCVKAIVHGRRR
jgi:glycosyltransferase involved in cell wall biosynthesis